MRSRLLAGVPALLLLASLSACGDDDTKASSDPTTDAALSSDTTEEAPDSATTQAAAGCDFVPGAPAAREVDLPNPNPTRTGTLTAVLKSSVGDLKVTLDADRTPCTVESFVSLVEQGYYDNTSCHRQGNQPGFEFLQCGDPNFDPKAETPSAAVGSGGPGYTIPDELEGTETYPAGTLAMANTSAPNTGGGQFFITFGDSDFGGPNYTVWGKLDAASLKALIAATKSGNDDYWTSVGSSGGRPNTPVTFNSIKVG